jgi:hypothetical protein
MDRQVRWIEIILYINYECILYMLKLYFYYYLLFIYIIYIIIFNL